MSNRGRAHSPLSDHFDTVKRVKLSNDRLAPVCRLSIDDTWSHESSCRVDSSTDEASEAEHKYNSTDQGNALDVGSSPPTGIESISEIDFPIPAVASKSWNGRISTPKVCFSAVGQSRGGY